MTRTKTFHAHGDDPPNLKIERFRASGNSPGAVVYLRNEKAVKFDGKYYRCIQEIPKSAVITKAYEFWNDRIIIHARTGPGKTDTYIFHKSTILDTEQKSRLKDLMNTHGTAMGKEFKTLLKGIKRCREVVEKYSEAMDSACPGLNLRSYLTEQSSTPPEFMCPPQELSAIKGAEKMLENLDESYSALAKAEPFAFKRSKA